ncbi:MAG TPA: type IV toxin-antitoxin system AbiEi family antitoxin domain-containing protein [Solirubrobacteraceae bacterium]|nr:type IV toxin-antitoxin system AbiEi family antitoxin domain-containing protein [Solirubrobacteraceae bacterium]
MRPRSRTVERVLAAVAETQHGLVTRAQLVEAGVTGAEIKQRAATGALIRVHLGVYRVGHAAPSVPAAYLGAVLACGEGDLLAGRAGAWWSGLVKGEAPRPEVLCRTERRVPGVRTRRCRGLDPADGRIWRGIPTTTPARTLTDLAALLPLDALARACHEAGVLHRTTPADVEAVLQRRPTTPGAAKLRAVLNGDAPVTLSELERRFLARLRAAGLPPPHTNKAAGGRYVDCRWPEHRLTVELDSFRFHNSRHTWELDRRREREAYGRGDDFRRYTWHDVAEDPRALLAELASVLDGGRRTTTGQDA